jgi:PAS domain S-box-containing protein
MSLADPAFRVIFEDAPFGIAVVDRELRIVDVNAAYCELLGYAKEELLKRSVPEITHPEDRQRDIEFVQLLLAGRLPRYKAEKRYITKSGQVVWANLTVTPLRAEGGKPHYVFGMIENITDRKLLRQFLPVCSSCKKVRDERGLWSEVGAYLREHASTRVAEELCPDCQRKRAG